MSIAALGFAVVCAGVAQADTVRVSGASYSGKTAPYLQQMAREFHAANPDIDIMVEIVGRDSLPRNPVGSAGADIAIVESRRLPELVAGSWVEPLDPMMSGEFKARFIRPLLGSQQIGGKTYGLPFAVSAGALYYNKDLLVRAGVAAPPATWDEVQADAAKLKAAGVAGFGVQGKARGTDVYWYYALWTEGGELVGPDGRAALDSPAGLKALTVYRTMIDDGLTQPKPSDCSGDDLRALFQKGEVAMLIADQSLIDQIAAAAPGLNYGVAPVPAGTRGGTYAETDSAVLSKASKVKPIAWKFLDFLFTRGPRVAFSTNEGFLPTTRAGAADPYFAKNERLQVFVKGLPGAHFEPRVMGWGDAERVVSEALRSVYDGAALPAAALNAAATRVNQVLGR
jgi:multiple sugar transport system substrate-binding protein